MGLLAMVGARTMLVLLVLLPTAVLGLAAGSNPYPLLPGEHMIEFPAFGDLRNQLIQTEAGASQDLTREELSDTDAWMQTAVEGPHTISTQTQVRSLGNG